MKRKERYLNMFIGLGPRVRLNEPSQSTIGFEKATVWAMKHLRKDDRIVWFLSIVQRAALLRMRESGESVPLKMRRKIERKLKGFEAERVYADFESGFMLKWPHYQSLVDVYQLGRMKDYSFHLKEGNRLIPKTADEVLCYHEEMDKKLEELAKGERFCADGEPFIVFDDGWAWYMIREGGSVQEAKAMRHCGNGVGSEGDRLLSLREPIRKGDLLFWKPHLTFILNNGVLGEMKGYANTKPDSRYHPYVESLLEHKVVREVRGGSYLPKNNFSFSDLTSEGKIRVLEKKPDLLFDPIGDEGEILSEGEGFRWLKTDKPQFPCQVYDPWAVLLGNETPVSEWIALQTLLDFSVGTAWSTLAWFELHNDRTIGALHIPPKEPLGILEHTLSELLLLPQLENFSFAHDPLSQDSNWGKALGIGGCRALMTEKPVSFKDSPLKALLNLVGLCDAYMAVIKHRFSMDFRRIAEGIELKQFDSLSSFAEETCNGSYQRVLEQCDPASRRELLGKPPFEVPWLRLCPTESKQDTRGISLVLTSDGADIFFDIIDFQNIENLQSIVLEINYRFGLRGT